MHFLDSVQLVLVQNFFWWTVMCSSLAVLLRFFVITSLADSSIKPRSRDISGSPVRMSGAAVWVVLHSGGPSDDNGPQRNCNFLVSSNGEVMEGRGWGITGSTNNTSIDIYLSGDFKDKPPPEKQVTAVRDLISTGVSGGHITADYKLVSHRQLQSPPSSSPGDRLHSMIQQWPGYTAHIE